MKTAEQIVREKFSEQTPESKVFILECMESYAAQFKEKAEKWDKLHTELWKYYSDADGEYTEDNPVKKGDLTDMGEEAAMAFGFL
jgi:hypothetical protein